MDRTKDTSLQSEEGTVLCSTTRVASSWTNKYISWKSKKQEKRTATGLKNQSEEKCIEDQLETKGKISWRIAVFVGWLTVELKAVCCFGKE